MLTDAARQLVEQRNQERLDRIEGRRPLYDTSTANRIGAVTEITYGVEIWTVEDGRRDYHGDPLGGIVVDVDPGRAPTVDENGEIIDHPPRYRCYDPLAEGFPYGSFRWITEPEINRGSVGPSDTIDLIRAVYRFCHHVGKNLEVRQRRRASNVLDGFDADLICYADRLKTVLMMGAR